jgi:hypothetical protein
MCKKLMFLISLVALLGVASSALAADLIVNWPDEYTVSGTEEYDKIECGGKIIVPSGATLIGNDESKIDGNGDDGEGGDGASIIINGGTVVINARFNIGTDHDGYLYIYDGGSFTQQCCGSDWEDGFKFPDNSGGEHRIFVIDGTLDCYAIEYKDDRDAEFIVGCNGTIIVGETDEGDDYDPYKWLDNGDLYCDPNCTGIIMIFDLGDNVKEIICFEVTCKAWMPSPKDEAINEAAVTCDMILSWNEGNCLGTKGKNFVFFGDCDCVENAPTGNDPGYNAVPCWQIRLNQGFTTWNAGPLPLWTTYCWRIDQGCADATVCRGDVWTFTTGCELIGGDANLDCHGRGHLDGGAVLPRRVYALTIAA